MKLIEPITSAADQVDIHLLRCQQLRLYILKAARALLSHQDKLRQILSQPAVVDVGPNPSGKTSVYYTKTKYLLCTLVLCTICSKKKAIMFNKVTCRRSPVLCYFGINMIKSSGSICVSVCVDI